MGTRSLTVPSAKAEITFPRADKDLLIFLASSRTAPSAPVLLTYQREEKDVSGRVTKNSHQDEVRVERLIPPLHKKCLLYLEAQEVTNVNYQGYYLFIIHSTCGTQVNQHT